MGSALDPRRLQYIDNLKYVLSKYEESLEQAQSALKEAQALVGEWNDRIESAKNLLLYEEEENGIQIRLDANSPYRGMSVRDAALKVIRDKGGESVTLVDIQNLLVANAYIIESRFPGRSIHASLIGAEEVKKVASGTYRWLGATTTGELTMTGELTAVEPPLSLNGESDE